MPDESTIRSSHEQVEAAALAAKETKGINILRIVTLILLVTIAITASVVIFVYTKEHEQEKFETIFTMNAMRIIDAFQENVERKLAAMNSMADAITSHALATGEQFPRVTLPHFEVHGSNVRVQSGASIVQWSPLVTDETREEWEEYALAKRFHLDEAFANDVQLRDIQDEEFGLSINYTTIPRKNYPEDNVLDDGTNYHPRIFSNGVVTERGDEVVGGGPFLPLWQRSPIGTKKQAVLNFNLANSRPLHGVLENVLQSKEAIMHNAEVVKKGNPAVQENLDLSQYREESVEYLGDPHTFIAYPVFTSFDEDRQVAGVISANTYWRLLFANVLPHLAKGYLCILRNSFNQTLAYRVDGREVTFIGEEDTHDARFEYLEQSADINEFVRNRSSVRTRPYTMVPLNTEFGSYRLFIYPTEDTMDPFLTSTPWVATAAVLSVFILTVIILAILDRTVARRQRLVMDRLLKAAEEKATFEHDLNAFLAHEVRNPVAAAISAHGFMVSSLNELLKTMTTSTNSDLLTSLKGDAKIIGSSLFFIDDFLRSILDIHASMANKLEVHLTPTDLLKDVLEPVQSMLCQRDGRIDVSIHCPEGLVIMTDCLRLKQIMMNLGRNSLKFTTSGFVHFCAVLPENGLVELHVEDTGAGIPEEKRVNLFAKFQSSLDVLSQGTGIGLSLCEQLVALLKGCIFLDENYDSGIAGTPGSRFVVQLNQACLPPESILITSKHRVPVEEEIGNSIPSSLEAGIPTKLPENVSVLFVDDDNVLRKLFCRAVEKAAPTWSVAEAASGEAALQLVVGSEHSKSYDVIFMDQYMTSTEKQLLGTETVAKLRSRNVGCTICGLSANNMEEAFLNAGADAFLLKPFPCDRSAMQRELARILQSRSAA